MVNHCKICTRTINTFCSSVHTADTMSHLICYALSRDNDANLEDLPVSECIHKECEYCKQDISTQSHIQINPKKNTYVHLACHESLNTQSLYFFKGKCNNLPSLILAWNDDVVEKNRKLALERCKSITDVVDRPKLIVENIENAISGNSDPKALLLEYNKMIGKSPSVYHSSPLQFLLYKCPNYNIGNVLNNYTLCEAIMLGLTEQMMFREFGFSMYKTLMTVQNIVQTTGKWDFDFTSLCFRKMDFSDIQFTADVLLLIGFSRYAARAAGYTEDQIDNTFLSGIRHVPDHLKRKT